MKKILIFIGILISLGASAQVDTLRKLQSFAGYGLELNNEIVNGMLRIPRDTFTLKQADSGSIAYKSGFWVWNGSKWSAISGSGGTVDYNALINKPTIPTNTNQLTNGAGFLTTADVSGKLDASDTTFFLAAYQSGLLGRVRYTDTSVILSSYRDALNNRATNAALTTAQGLNVKYTDTSTLLSPYQTAINNRVKYTDTTTMLTAYRNALLSRVLYTDTSTILTAYRNALNSRLRYTDSSTMLGAYQTALLGRVRYTDTSAMLTDYRNALNAISGGSKLNISDTSSMLTAYRNALNSRLRYTDTSGMLGAYQAAYLARVRYTDTTSMLAAYQTGLLGRLRYTDTTSLLSAYQSAINGRIKYTDSSSMLSTYATALNARLKIADTATMLTAYQNALNARTAAIALKLNISDTASMQTAYQNALNSRVRYTDTSGMLSAYQSALNARFKYSDTTSLLSAYQTAINARVKYTDTSSLLSSYQSGLLGRLRYTDTSSLLTAYQNALNSRVRYTDTATMLTAYRNSLNSKANLSGGNTLAGDQVFQNGPVLNTIAAPSATASSTTVYSSNVSGRQMVAQLANTTGASYTYQPLLGRGKVTFYTYAGNTTSGAGQLAANITGSTPGAVVVAAGTGTSSDLFGSIQRMRVSSSGASGNVAGFRNSNKNHQISTSTGTGGFFAIFSCGISTSVANSTAFVGFHSTAGNLPNSTDPSALVDMIGFAFDRGGNATWKFMQNDGSGTATSTDMGANFPGNTSGVDWYEFTIYIPSGQASIAYYNILRKNTGQSASGSVTTNLPTTHTLLNWNISVGNGTTLSAASLDFSSAYIETEN